MSVRVPIECILPPHMLENVAQKGSTPQRARALQTLAVSERIRGQREALGAIDLRALAPARPTTGQLDRTVYTAQNQETLPGTPRRVEGGPPTGDAAVDEAYDGAGATYELYWKQFERDSFDDRGARIDSTVHYGQDYGNAFWNGRQMVYGDGDGELFRRFTVAVDIIGHELTHAVTQFEAGLVYALQPGAINEHMSDVFGSLVKQYVKGQAAGEADWLIGEGLFTPNVEGVAIRSMKAPGTAYDDDVLGKDPQPAHMRDLYVGAADNGGVHINSGIPNHAFYRAATAIGGNAWERAGKIWYLALRDRLRPVSDFADCARATTALAADLYGPGGREHRAVRDAWTAVGIPPAEGPGRGGPSRREREL